MERKNVIVKIASERNDR